MSSVAAIVSLGSAKSSASGTLVLPASTEEPIHVRHWPPPLSRAARELGNILGEGLRSELQSLDCREIRENRLGELLDRQTAFDGERCRLDTVGALGREDVRAEELSAARLGDELDEATCVARGQRPRHVAQLERGGLDLESL